MDIKRPIFHKKISESFEVHPACAILGPRQCGKTTLSKAYAKSLKNKKVHYFDLEDPTDLARLENPKLALDPLEGLIVLDEIQRRPEIFPYLRVFVDQYPNRQILILGSASRELINQSSETLAGRISYVELPPFSLSESKDLEKLWSRGGFPRSYLASNAQSSYRWRRDFIRTFLEMDIRALGFDVSSHDMRRLWTMLAHYHANLINYSELGRSLGVSDNTIRRYTHVLEGTFMVRLLKPWFVNIKKRQVKAPKIYIRDSGILHTLLNIEDETINLNPKVGASWEGFALEEVIRIYGAESEDCYFWSTVQKAEIDLLLDMGNQKKGFEFKYSDSPKITKSMIIALEELKLDHITVVIPGDRSFKLADNIFVQGLSVLQRS